VDDAAADEEDDEEDDEVEDDEAASATPQKITVAMKIPARAAEFANEARQSAVRLMALGKPTSWLRRKNIPQVPEKRLPKSTVLQRKPRENRLRMRRFHADSAARLDRSSLMRWLAGLPSSTGPAT
jgi:hypothetical protein